MPTHGIEQDRRPTANPGVSLTLTMDSSRFHTKPDALTIKAEDAFDQLSSQRQALLKRIQTQKKQGISDKEGQSIIREYSRLNQAHAFLMAILEKLQNCFSAIASNIR